jgi:hypothetical protein
MRKMLFILGIALCACGQNTRQREKDVTDGTEENISPNQTISEEEQNRKDSTNGDIVGKDTTVVK